MAKFYQTFELLTDFPQIGHLRPDVASNGVRFFFVKPYWILYQPGSPLLIHRVYHAARDLNRMVLDED